MVAVVRVEVFQTFLMGIVENPKLFGSGGSANRMGSNFGGNGGGIIRFVTDNLVLNGSIIADGGNGEGNAGDGGGSGGSINIEAGTISGSGVISANGGIGNVNGGGGGGGRIAIAWQNGTIDNWNLSARGGFGNGGTGGAGTIYLTGPATGTMDN